MGEQVRDLEGTNWAGGLLLKIFLVLIFFVHYQTIGIPGTLHSWVLIAGVAVTIPVVVKRFVNSGFRLPLDYALVALIALLIVLGFVTNLGDSTLSQLQAYLLGLACYVFVREQTPALSLSFFSKLILWFLLINSVLMVLQFMTGRFYVARFLAFGDPPFLLPSGLSDGPTKNGMLHGFALSFVFARLLWLREKRYLEKGIFLLGFLTLILSSSRAAIAAFVLAAVAGAVLVAAYRKRAPHTRKRSALRTYAVVALLVVILGRIIVLIPELVNRQEYNYAANIIAYKFALGDGDASDEEGSVGTRFQTARMAVDQTLQDPMHTLAVGFGVGSYEKNDGINVHNSYLEFWYEIGLLGFVVFLYLIAHVTRKATVRRDPLDVVPVLVGLVSIMVFMAFHDILRGRIFWIPLAMLAGLAYQQPRGAQDATRLGPELSQ